MADFMIKSDIEQARELLSQDARTPFDREAFRAALELLVGDFDELFAGISDPAAFVERAKAMEIWFIRNRQYPRRFFDDLTPEEIAALAQEWTEDE